MKQIGADAINGDHKTETEGNNVVNSILTFGEPSVKKSGYCFYIKRLLSYHERSLFDINCYLYYQEQLLPWVIASFPQYSRSPFSATKYFAVAQYAEALCAEVALLAVTGGVG